MLFPFRWDEDHISIAKLTSRDSLLYTRVRGLVVHSAQADAERNSPEQREATAQIAEEFSPKPNRFAGKPDPELRRMLTDQLDRSEIGILWFDTFNTSMNDHLPEKPIAECVVELLVRSKKRGVRELLYDSIALLLPDHGPYPLNGRGDR
jgi:hypothetical protein